MVINPNLMLHAVDTHIHLLNANPRSDTTKLEVTVVAARRVEKWLPLLINPIEWLSEWKATYPTLHKLYEAYTLGKEWGNVEKGVHRWVSDINVDISMELMEHLLANVPPLEEDALSGLAMDIGMGNGFGHQPVIDNRSPWSKAQERLVLALAEISVAAMQSDLGDQDRFNGQVEMGRQVGRLLGKFGLKIVIDNNRVIY